MTACACAGGARSARSVGGAASVLAAAAERADVEAQAVADPGNGVAGERDGVDANLLSFVLGPREGHTARF